MSEPEYPSYAETSEILAPKIAEFTANTNYAEYEDPATPPIRYRAVVREKGFSATARAPSVGSASGSDAWRADHRASSDGVARSTIGAPLPASFAPPLLHEFKTFLEQIDKNPTYNVRLHAKAFGSASRFSKIKEHALRERWVTEEKVRTARTGHYSLLLRLTEAGKSALTAL